MLQTMKTKTKTWTREELEAMSLPPMAPKIREAHMKLWKEPTFLHYLDVGDEGIWVALHGEEDAATDPSLETVSRLVDHYGPDEIMTIHLAPDDDILIRIDF